MIDYHLKSIVPKYMALNYDIMQGPFNRLNKILSLLGTHPKVMTFGIGLAITAAMALAIQSLSICGDATKYDPWNCDDNIVDDR
jgi:hypothetical protein